MFKYVLYLILSNANGQEHKIKMDDFFDSIACRKQEVKLINRIQSDDSLFQGYDFAKTSCNESYET